MPDLLLELFSEEIPARMQAGAARDLERLMIGALTDRGFLFEGIKAFAGPRRLTLAIAGLPAKQSDVREELKGPKTDAPPAALEGFLKKTSLTKDQLKVEKTPKGEVYMAVIERAGRETPHVLAEIIPEVMAKLPWPKSMRWKPGSSVRWVRPLHSILCTFDGELVPFSFAGISTGLHTRGHRFLSEGKIEARRFDDYAQKLKANHVVLEAEERSAIIFEGVKQAAFVHGLEMIPDEGLLAEVCGLAEWPTVYVGTIQDEFMDVPAEILQTSMRTHQKYFSLREPQTSENKPGKMANRFALVANMVAKDGGKEIVAGNERVLRARLSDAKFFWDEDRKKSLRDRGSKLTGIVFHKEVGTQSERSLRIAAIAQRIAVVLHGDVELTAEAALLCKADLTSGVVGEFPELQGIMGGYYAAHDGAHASVAEAIREHYRPLGPNDDLPSTDIGSFVAIADKTDTIAALFYAGEIPTGSSDPFALRRAALGVIRIILHNKLRLGLSDPITRSLILVMAAKAVEIDKKTERQLSALAENPALHRQIDSVQLMTKVQNASAGAALDEMVGALPSLRDQVLKFFADRLKVALKEKGVRHDLIDAAFSLGNEDDLVRLVARVEALQAFLKSDDGANLLAGYKRAANILKAEEKKEGKIFTSEVLETKLSEPFEQALFTALAQARAAITAALEKEDFAAAMQQMAALRVPVDAFFKGVKVNADDKQVRENRLNLLASLRAALHQVADFSRIEG
ncbi:MAG: glycine--tRNA ligase subunit beta [Alphaproteobacteria bacterium]|nr:glycine--tRNA ligase subunit beta [Alphaproteobacteria bacterium]